MRSCFTALSVVAALALLVNVGLAQSTNNKINIGEKAPDFKELPGIDDKKYSLADCTKDTKCTVVVITCNHCPIATAYEDRLIQFVKDYEPKGVKLVAINVNNMEEDKLPGMKARASKKGFNFPYLYDSSQQIGQALGAAVTPEFFVIDASGKIAFTGAMDDNNNAAKATKHYLRDAVEALLAKKPVEVGKVERRGCPVKYDGTP
ncbi:MAG: thioredoxin family protein [Planctomycetaceae bacterium]